MVVDPWRWENGETSVALGGKLETSVKSCEQRTQSVVGDSCGRHARNHADNSIQSGLGDKWETSLKSCGQRSRRQVGDGPEHSEHPECTAWKTSGDRWRRDQSAPSIQGVLGAITGRGCSGTSLGENPEIRLI